jgi:hypothetical protein
MTNYRVEAWISHSEDNDEDFLESRITDLFNANSMRVQDVVVFRMYHMCDLINPPRSTEPPG